MKEIRCRKCKGDMYLPSPLRKGLDIYETIHHDGLEAKLVCQECGNQERGIFVFARFTSDSLSPEEIAYLHSRAQATQKILQRNKRIYVVCKLFGESGPKNELVHGYLTYNSHGLPVFISSHDDTVISPSFLGERHLIVEDNQHPKDLADTAKMFAHARNAGYNVKI